MKHTPGPWKLDHDVIVSIKDRDGDWPTICKRDEHSVIDEYMQWVANARLIAAAPKMLKALYQALARLEAAGLEDTTTDIIKAAIHNAVGESK